MINYQEYIATKLKKTLEKMINLSTLCLNNLIAIIIGIYNTTIDDRFVILQFSLKVSKIDIQILFKLFKYKFVGQKG